MVVVQCHMQLEDKSLQHHSDIAAHQNSLANMADIYHGDTAPHTCDFHMAACLQCIVATE